MFYKKTSVFLLPNFTFIHYVICHVLIICKLYLQFLIAIACWSKTVNTAPFCFSVRTTYILDTFKIIIIQTKRDSQNPKKMHKKVFSFSYYPIKKSSVEMLGQFVLHST